MQRTILSCLLLLSVLVSSGSAAELVTLTAENWESYQLQGKEVDCIYGDYMLRNDRIVVVVARPVAGRNANMTVRDVGGSIIDLTRRNRQNDQLSAYYPGGSQFAFVHPELTRAQAGDESVSAAEPVQMEAERVSLACTAPAADGKPQATVRYLLEDGQAYVIVESVLENTHDKPVTVALNDAVRADRTFAFGAAADTNLFWAADEWFQQAYGVVAEDHQIQAEGERRGRIVQFVKDGQTSATIQPGEKYTIRRKIFPGAHLLQVRAIANRLAGKRQKQVRLEVTDPAGAVRHARITALAGDQEYGSARTARNGKTSFGLPEAVTQLKIEALGRPAKTIDAAELSRGDNAVQLEACGYVRAKITGADGNPIPCKIAFHGKDGTPSPDFGPDSAARGVQNVYYSHNGTFRQELSPGKYDVIVSYGPEYDAVFTELEVKRGENSALRAKLVRTVDTTGWVSSDFHSHSSPSGDNTSSQLGRVLNLLCEHVEFAPCTEHNRLSTYQPHLKRLNVERLMATCTGMELTGGPGSVNHQNAFPLIHKPHTQDGGAPVTDSDPVVQIERLALWDGGSDKLVQTNHPNIVQILGDRDLDGQSDGGFESMFGYMDVIEVHPPHMIFDTPDSQTGSRGTNNRIFNWLQTLNIGYRVPGVVNTDAHYTYHGSGGLRNYLKSSTDDPAQVDTMEMVHAAEHGHIIMTNGPFLEVELNAEEEGDKAKGIAGDDVAAPSGKATLSVRVQCPNWIDVNRVQLFLNGRPAKDLNYTRRSHPDYFSRDTVRFEAELPLQLDGDTHVIVATAGEGLTLGRIMGPDWGDDMPVAVSNPIFVDVDGDGFKPNGDTLGVPLPR